MLCMLLKKCPIGVYFLGLIFLPGISVAESTSKLTPFSSDGCSVFPDGTLKDKVLWQSCCWHHDLAYWVGGNYQQRINADLELKACVAELGEPEVAQVMWMGVQMGGSPYWPTQFRWGYGWPYPRGYKALSQEEKQQVNLLLLEQGQLNSKTN